MEFDIKQLDYLELEIVKVIKNSRFQTTIFAIDFKKNERLVVRVFDSLDDENLVYKINKVLYNLEVSSKICFRNVINGFPYLIYKCLGPDLSRLFNFMGNSFTDKTIMLIGYRLVI